MLLIFYTKKSQKFVHVVILNRIVVGVTASEAYDMGGHISKRLMVISTDGVV